MGQIQRSFISCNCGTEVPAELKMGANKLPEHEIQAEHLSKSYWNDRLLEGLLYTETQDMVSDITEYLTIRSSRNEGNSNDPWNLVCYELLVWLTAYLSGAKCNKDTLETVQARHKYLNTLADPKVFNVNDDGSARTMLGVLTGIKKIFIDKVIPIIEREIANTHVRDHLAELKMFGKVVLDYGFQFLYFALRKTADPPAADISCLSTKITSSRSGQLLECLAQTSAYCKIFETHDPFYPEGSNTTDSPLPSQDQTFANPFIDANNQLALPHSLQAVTKCDNLDDFLGEKGQRKSGQKTGIYKPFRENPNQLNNYVEMHALLLELAKTFIACDEAYKSAGIGGDLLIYGESNKLINELMATLKKLSEALFACHNRIKAATNKQEGIETSKISANLSTTAKNWLENYRNLASINTQLENSLNLCIRQANFIQESSNRISVTARFDIAKKQTLYFTQTATWISSHVNQFLERGSSGQSSHQPQAASLRPRSPTSPRISLEPAPPKSPRESSLFSENTASIPRARSTTITIGVKTSSTSSILTKKPNKNPGESTHTAAPRDILDLRRNANRVITDNSIKFIAQRLLKTPELTVVNLKNNLLSASNTEALWKALRQCTTLRELILTNNPTLLSVTLNSKAGKSAQSTNIELIGQSISAVREFIENTTCLRTLKINACGLDTTSACLIANGLAKNNTIEVLDIRSNPLGNDGVAAICGALQNNTKLYDLRIAYVQLTDIGANHVLTLLKNCQQITDIMLDDAGVSEAMKQKICHQLQANRDKLLSEENPFRTPAN